MLFLNNDTKVISPDWLEKMLGCFLDESVGVVGAKLLYADGTIQHLGVEVGGENVAVHSMRKMKERDIPKEFQKPFVCDAVTGACMMTRKELFLSLGGFDEVNLPIAYNDIEYCLRVRRAGYSVLCQPEAKLFHYESASRMNDLLARWIRPSRYREFLKEREYLGEQLRMESAPSVSQTSHLPLRTEGGSREGEHLLALRLADEPPPPADRGRE